MKQGVISFICRQDPRSTFSNSVIVVLLLGPLPLSPHPRLSQCLSQPPKNLPPSPNIVMLPHRLNLPHAKCASTSVSLAEHPHLISNRMTCTATQAPSTRYSTLSEKAPMASFALLFTGQVVAKSQSRRLH